MKGYAIAYRSIFIFLVISAVAGIDRGVAGNFDYRCIHPFMNGKILNAQCYSNNGSYNSTTLDLGRGIRNKDGVLVFEKVTYENKGFDHYCKNYSIKSEDAATKYYFHAQCLKGNAWNATKIRLNDGITATVTGYLKFD